MAAVLRADVEMENHIAVQGIHEVWIYTKSFQRSALRASFTQGNFAQSQVYNKAGI